MTPIEHLKAEIKENIKECQKFEKRASKIADYTDAIKLQGMADAYKTVLRKIERILEKPSN